MVSTSSTRNIFILALCQALFMSTLIMSIAVASIAARQLVDDESLITIPQALIPLLTLIMTIPASFIIRKLGIKIGFTLGIVSGILSGLIASIGLFIGSYLLFVIGVSIIGIYQSFATYYRLVAADEANPNNKGNAISYVLLGGILAAFLGPSLASISKDLFTPFLFLGSYIITIVLNLIALILISSIKLNSSIITGIKKSSVSFSDVFFQYNFLMAVLFCAFSNAIMMLIMTATPISMINHNHSVISSNAVISWHVVAMFLPSFFTGQLIKKIGLKLVLLIGLILMSCASLYAITGFAVIHYTIALILVGVGWNFLYIGGSTLLSLNISESDKALKQGINEFATFGFTALSTFGSGALLYLYGWSSLHYVSLIGVSILFIGLLFIKAQKN